MKNPDVNALSPGGWCRCSGQGIYGCDSSCDAPVYLVYHFTRPHHQSIDAGTGKEIIIPTYNFWDCWNGNAEVYFKLIPSAYANGESYPAGGPYAPYTGCHDLPFAYRYVATWIDPSDSQEKVAGVLDLLCDVNYDGYTYRKQLRMVLTWNLPSLGPCYDCSTNPNTPDYGGATAEPPYTFICPDMAPPYLLYESPPKLTLKEAQNARIPCLSGCDTVFKYMRQIDSDYYVGGNPEDEIYTSNDTTINGVTKNTELIAHIAELSETCMFCHCSEVMDGSYKYLSTSNGRYYGVPTSVTFSLGGFPSSFIVQTTSTSYREYDYSNLNGTHTATSDSPEYGAYTVLIPCTIKYWICDNGEKVVSAEWEIQTFWSLVLRRCFPQPRPDLAFYPPCRRIELGWSDELPIVEYFFGGDIENCGYDTYFDGLSPGFSNAVKCSEMAGSSFGMGFNDYHYGFLSSTSASIISLNP